MTLNQSITEHANALSPNYVTLLAAVLPAVIAHKGDNASELDVAIAAIDIVDNAIEKALGIEDNSLDD